MLNQKASNIVNDNLKPVTTERLAEIEVIIERNTQFMPVYVVRIIKELIFTIKALHEEIANLHLEMKEAREKI